MEGVPTADVVAGTRRLPTAWQGVQDRLAVEAEAIDSDGDFAELEPQGSAFRDTVGGPLQFGEVLRIAGNFHLAAAQ